MNIDTNNSPVIYLDVDDLDVYYQTHKNNIDMNREYYLSFVKSNKLFYDDFKFLCNAILEINSSRGKQINKKGGASSLATAGVVSSFVLAGIVAYIIWNYVNAEEPCKEKYPLYSLDHPDRIPAVEAILQNIIPENWITSSTKKGSNIADAIKDSGEYLMTLVEIFSIFDEKAGSTFEQTLKTTSKITLSVGATLLSAGMGGDKIVNLPFFIAKAINMTSKIFNTLKDVGNKLADQLSSVSQDLIDMNVSIKNVMNSVDSQNKIYEKSTQTAIKNFKTTRTQLTFIYDMFNVDFKGGPRNSECWVNYVISNYMKSENASSLFCTINDIYQDINDVLIEFIGSAMDMISPISLSLTGTLSPLLENYSYDVYREALENMTSNYMRIPKEFRDLIENPPLMKDYMFNKLKKYTFGVSSLVVPESVEDHIGTGIDVLAYGIHNGLGIIFMFLNVFVIFSEIDKSRACN